MNYDFVDFGCGRGNSYKYGLEKIGPNGLGIDNSPDNVMHCAAVGMNVAFGDILDWDKKNIADAAIAFDIMPFIGALPQFRLALTNIIKSASSYGIIQHTYYDDDNILLKHNHRNPSARLKNLQLRPMSSDYIEFSFEMAKRLEIVGLAIFGVGTVKPSRFDEPNQSNPGGDDTEYLPNSISKSLRVVIGRKKIDRFNFALNKFSTPNILYYTTFE